MTTYTADDVRAVQTYMAYKAAGVIPTARDLQAAYFRGQDVLKEAVIRYSADYGEARAAPKESPIIARNYQGTRTYYWLLDRATFNSIRQRSGKKKK